MKSLSSSRNDFFIVTQQGIHIVPAILDIIPLLNDLHISVDIIDITDDIMLRSDIIPTGFCIDQSGFDIRQIVAVISFYCIREHADNNIHTGITIDTITIQTEGGLRVTDRNHAFSTEGFLHLYPNHCIDSNTRSWILQNVQNVIVIIVIQNRIRFY